jgi:hypothetical protein
MKRAEDMRWGALMRVFAWPLVLAVLSALGLLFALLGDGAWDVASWLLLAVPIAAIAWAIVRAGPRSETGRCHPRQR